MTSQRFRPKHGAGAGLGIGWAQPDRRHPGSQHDMVAPPDPPSSSRSALLGAAGARAADDQLASFAESLTAPAGAADRQGRSLRAGLFEPAHRRRQGQAGFRGHAQHPERVRGPGAAIERVDFFDTTGKLVEKFLAKPVAIKPLGTIEIFIAKDDVRGGTGANFIVGWAAAGAIVEPVIETVMISSLGNFSYSFVSQGGRSGRSAQNNRGARRDRRPSYEACRAAFRWDDVLTALGWRAGTPVNLGATLSIVMPPAIPSRCAGSARPAIRAP
ncbi:MAG: DUF3124 domain-containing protein [Pseudomonadota bacterium]